MTSPTLADLIFVYPTTGGASVGFEDFRLSVQLATTATMWGRSKWGNPTQWTDGWTWYDLTPYTMGADWERGMPSPAERPRAGTGMIDLQLPADGSFAPWLYDAYPFLDEGAVIRVVAWKPGAGAYPQFVGTVETVEEVPTTQDAWRRVLLHLVEPLFKDLALIDGSADTPAGAGEAASTRVQRLIAAAAYRLGTALYSSSSSDIVPTPTMQATDWSRNRLADIYLTCDSADIHFFQLRDGTAHTERKPSNVTTTTPTPLYMDGSVMPMLGERSEVLDFAPYATRVMPYKEPPHVARYDEALSTVTFARVGGVAQTVTGGSGRGAGRRSTRSDLLCESDTSVAHLAQRELDRGAIVSHVVTTKTDAFMDPHLYALAMSLDLLQKLPVWRELAQQPAASDVVLRGYVTHIRHTVGSFNTAQLAWQSEYTTAVLSLTYGTPTGP